MAKEKCEHMWQMINVAVGMIVMKKCFHCSKVSTCFAFHHEPPLEPNRDGVHFWNFMESDESFHFDLECTACGTIVKLDELVGLMMCTGCDGKCRVHSIRYAYQQENTRVCIALGRRPIDERKQLLPEKFAVLEEFINQQNKSAKSPIKLVNQQLVRNLAKCYAEPIRDVNRLFSIDAQAE